MYLLDIQANPAEGREEETGVEIPASKATVLRGHEKKKLVSGR